jgi:ADP-dependent NAD(P)H-hydrate dehydratase / NAD(P)H-hydrate epimerase
MEPIVSSEQMKAAEAHAVQGGISELELMDRAGTGCAQHVLEAWRALPHEVRQHGHVALLVGMGNNGGDGLVIARILISQGVPVEVHQIMHRTRPSPWFEVQLERYLLARGDIDRITSEHLPDLVNALVLVDAMLGTGQTRPLDPLISTVVSLLNASPALTISIDVPTGLYASEGSTPCVVMADRTLAIEWVKDRAVWPEHADAVGGITIVPIGLDASPFNPVQFILSRADVRAMVRARPVPGHKGTFGHAILVAGSKGRFGAAVLATRACVRSGAGTVTAHVPSDAAQVIHTAVPEAMCSSDVDREHVTNLPKGLVGTTWGIGPGLGSEEATALVLKRLIQDPLGPLVMDADALNILAQQPTWMAFLAHGTILTPHPKEFDRLIGRTCSGTAERWAQGREMALRTGCVVVLKGGATAICTPSGQVLVQRWLNSGLAKGGSGDALTGLITGLRAQGYGPVAAACIGVYLHGSAARLVAEERGQDGMSVSDVIERIPEAWMALRSPLEEPFDGPLAVS